MRYFVLFIFSSLFVLSPVYAQDNKPGEAARGKAYREGTKIQYEEKSTKLPGQEKKGRPVREGTKIIYR